MFAVWDPSRAASKVSQHLSKRIDFLSKLFFPISFANSCIKSRVNRPPSCPILISTGVLAILSFKTSGSALFTKLTLESSNFGRSWGTNCGCKPKPSTLNCCAYYNSARLASIFVILWQKLEQNERIWDKNLPVELVIKIETWEYGGCLLGGLTTLIFRFCLLQDWNECDVDVRVWQVRLQRVAAILAKFDLSEIF